MRTTLGHLGLHLLLTSNRFGATHLGLRSEHAYIHFGPLALQSRSDVLSNTHVRDIDRDNLGSSD